MICENCEDKHNGVYGSGRFCSSKCARGFSTKAKRKEINKKVRKPLIKKICKECNLVFKVKNSKRKQIYCSKKCARLNITYYGHDKVDWSTINKKAYSEGRNYVGGGTTKWIKYKDIKVQGSYELNTCYILDVWKENKKIKDWEYTSDRFTYTGADDKKHTYLIDFKIFENDDSFYYLEVKGRVQEKDYLKWQAVQDAGHRLEIWFKKDIKKIQGLLG
jgi:ribosomal protein L24E